MSGTLTGAIEQHGISQPIGLMNLMCLPDALEALVALGELDWAQAILDAIDAGARAGDPGSRLTPGERRVAALAAERLSNKEIAAALFVSVHTVEVHLSKAYAKLGVHSRAQLARQLARTASP